MINYYLKSLISKKEKIITNKIPNSKFVKLLLEIPNIQKIENYYLKSLIKFQISNLSNYYFKSLMSKKNEIYYLKSLIKVKILISNFFVFFSEFDRKNVSRITTGFWYSSFCDFWSISLGQKHFQVKLTRSRQSTILGSIFIEVTVHMLSGESVFIRIL